MSASTLVTAIPPGSGGVPGSSNGPGDGGGAGGSPSSSVAIVTITGFPPAGPGPSNGASNPSGGGPGGPGGSVTGPSTVAVVTVTPGVGPGTSLPIPPAATVTQAWAADRRAPSVGVLILSVLVLVV